MALDDNAHSSPDAATPHPALERLDRLVGTWQIGGRTLDVHEDNIHGRVTIEWLPGKFFLLQRGEMDVAGFHVSSLEIVGYDPSTQVFSAYTYSNLGGVPMRYYWNVEGDVVTHWTEGSKYTGTFNAEGTILSG